LVHEKIFNYKLFSKPILIKVNPRLDKCGLATRRELSRTGQRLCISMRTKSDGIGKNPNNGNFNISGENLSLNEWSE
jgi:hypothetical protein